MLSHIKCFNALYYNNMKSFRKVSNFSYLFQVEHFYITLSHENTMIVDYFKALLEGNLWKLIVFYDYARHFHGMLSSSTECQRMHGIDKNQTLLQTC